MRDLNDVVVVVVVVVSVGVLGRRLLMSAAQLNSHWLAIRFRLRLPKVVPFFFLFSVDVLFFCIDVARFSVRTTPPPPVNCLVQIGEASEFYGGHQRRPDHPNHLPGRRLVTVRVFAIGFVLFCFYHIYFLPIFFFVPYSEDRQPEGGGGSVAWPRPLPPPRPPPPPPPGPTGSSARVVVR